MVTAPGAIGCSVLIGGVRVADGTPGDPDTDPTILSGLSVTWGRGTTVDQPEPATCTLRIQDIPGDQSFLDLIAVGRRLDVVATGRLWSPAAVETVEPLDATPPGPASARVAVTRPARGTIIDTGSGHALQLTTPADQPVQVTIPPAPWGTLGDPTAWDTVPATSAGQVWTATVIVELPPGASAAVRPTLHTAPWDRGAPIPDYPAVPVPTGGGTAILAGITPDVAGQWVGVQVLVAPPGWTWARYDHPAPAAGDTWSDADPTLTWAALTHLAVTAVSVLAPAGHTERSVLVFSGRVTDATAEYSAARGAVEIDVTATDFVADLGNRDVGAEPWPAEPLATRVSRVLAGVPGVSAIVDPRPAALEVSRLDVDRQQVAPLLADLATSADAVLWAATHATTGPYLWVEDQAERLALLRLVLDPGGLVVIAPAPVGEIPGATVIDTCDPLLEPVQWRQDVADVATRVAVTWRDQTTIPDPTERTETVVDAGLEAPAAAYGVRRVGVQTLLTSASDARTVAQLLLRRLTQTGWRAGGLVWALAATEETSDTTTRALDLLDGTLRLGRPIQMGVLPDWLPIRGATAGYLEGGHYAFEDGWWSLGLTVSSPAGIGASIRWTDPPAWAWLDISPTVRWADLAGVGI